MTTEASEKKGASFDTNELFNQIDENDQKAMAAIDRSITQPPENSRVFTITPAMSRYIVVRYNQHNRPKKPGHIGRYARDMEKGHWVVTGDNLKFSDAQRLRDGQNRLLACIKSGQPFRTHIVFGIPDEYFSKMDQGKIRGGSDLLAIEGVTHPGDTAAAVRWAELFMSGTVVQRTTFAPPEILELYRTTHSAVSNFITDAQHVKKATAHAGKPGQPTGVVAGALYAFDQIDPADAAKFAMAWASGKWSGQYKPIDVMQKRIREIEAQAVGRVHDVVRAALIVIAWNATRKVGKGDKKAFDWKLGDPFPAIL
jgi:hypothetical protein